MYLTPTKFMNAVNITKYLVHERYWQYHYLPMNSLSSGMYFLPSPLWCIANDHVFFDHPNDSWYMRCFKYSTVAKMYEKDVIRMNKKVKEREEILQKALMAGEHVEDEEIKSIFDWGYFVDLQRSLCLRFST